VSRRVFTIGAYGFSQDAFFKRLVDSGVDVFLDVRQRRGLRGARYAFANSGRLVPELASHGIAYRHVKELAPDQEIRRIQREADATAGDAKATREGLSPAFVTAYEERRTAEFDFADLARQLGNFGAPVVFCVEQRPEQCHRSLVAPRLAAALGADVIDLTP
jgi:uncharacterized protein (DUF488 family)